MPTNHWPVSTGINYYLSSYHPHQHRLMQAKDSRHSSILAKKSLNNAFTKDREMDAVWERNYVGNEHLTN